METIHVDVKNVLNTVSLDTINSLDAKAASAMEKLHNGTGAGNNFLGWLNLPSSTTAEVLDEIEQALSLIHI